MNRKQLILGLIFVLITGCNNPLPTSTPTSTPLPAPTGVIVPLDRMTLTPRPTPTLAFDILPLMDRWLIDFRFEFTGGEIIDRIIFSMSAGLEVDGAGQLSGGGEMVVSAFEPSCDMNVVEGSSFWVTIEGHIEPGAEGEQPVFVAELIPAEERLFQVYRGLCPDETIEVKSQLLWRALNILDLETFRVLAENGERSTATYRVRSPTQEEINYDLEVTIYVAR